MNIDFSKYSKYSKPGPRYTSYPTAPEFSEAFTYKNYTDAIAVSNLNKRDVSLYFHLPFCRSACYFCGCNVIFTSKEDKKERYIGYLKRELALLAKHLDTSRPVTQMHFGGGTPTFFSAEQLRVIIEAIKETFPNFTSDAEISCEVDPRYFNEDQMKLFSQHGFNRISFGVQDFEPQVQEVVHRIQPFDMTLDCMNLARKYGVKSINVDLIYGLPFQTLESFKRTLELTLKLDPDRLAVFNYAHVPWMKKTMRKFDETTLPSPEVKLEIMQEVIKFFTSHGYRMVGMDHFAKPEDELFAAIEKGELHRNFQGYTTKGGADLFGVGITSIGEGELYYAQNHKELELYEGAIDADKLPFYRGFQLSDDDKLRQEVIMSLMSNFKLDIKKIEREWHINFNEYFGDAILALQSFVDEDLLTVNDSEIKASETGELLIRNICMPFDAYLQKIPEDKRRFSKTV
jgi:oxygen-independent coproporphyrinogen III oxidase